MLGIVILNYKSWKETEKSISSIKGTVKCEYRIFLVDNVSPDESWQEFIKAYSTDEKVELIQTGANNGYAYGNNIGIKKAAEYGANAVLIANTDVIYYPGAIDEMYRALFRQQDVSVVGPRILDLEGNDTQFAARPLTLKRYFFAKKPLHYLADYVKSCSNYLPWDNKTNMIFNGMVSGSCFMIKTDDIVWADFLDEGTFLFYEEDILAHRLRVLDRKTLLFADAVVLHAHSTTIDREGIAFSRLHRYYSSLYTLRTYAGVGNVGLFFASMLNIIPYALNSIFNKSYRQRLPELIRKSRQLYKFTPGEKLKEFVDGGDKNKDPG